MVALDAHLHTVHDIVDHLKELGKKEWWATKEVQGEQIRSREDTWETTVRDLKWGGAITDRAWVGRSPQEWRSVADDEPERLLQYAQADFSVLRRALKRRKLKECRMLMSHATQIREFNRAAGKLQYSIQAIQVTVNRRAGTSMSLEVLAEQEAWAADQPMPTVAEIQVAINSTMATPA